MNQTRYRQFKDLLMEAHDYPRDSRERWLDEGCAGDAELRQEIDSLLKAEAAESFLEHRPVESLAEIDDIDATGQQFGRIRLDRLIVRGSMGEVYAGIDMLLQRAVAVKRMQSDLPLSASRRSAFLTEAQVLSGLQHPNICQVYDFFEDDAQDLLAPTGPGSRRPAACCNRCQTSGWHGTGYRWNARKRAVIVPVLYGILGVRRQQRDRRAF